MFRYFPVIILALILTACNSPSTVEPAVATTQDADPVSTPLAPQTTSMDVEVTQPSAAVEAVDEDNDVPQADSTPAVDVETSGDLSSCTVVSMAPTIGPTEISRFPAASDDDWVLGPADATVTLVAYCDLQQPACALFDPVALRLQADYPEDVRLVFRHFPLPTDDKALLAARAVEAAGIQSTAAFFDLKRIILEEQATWSGLTPADFIAWVRQEASAIGLDAEKFAEDIASEAVIQKAQNAQTEAMQIGIPPDLPVILINGSIYQGPQDHTNLGAIVNLTKLKARQFTGCPPIVVDPIKLYQAVIYTEKGDIIIELFPDSAPVAVNSFVFLARQGWFDDIYFHRVIPGFVVQTGDPSGTGYGGPGYAFESEIDPQFNYDQPGMVGMSNSGPNSNGSQFFITLAPAPQLDGQYPIFGQVVQGIDVINRITPRNPNTGDSLEQADKLISVTIEEL